MERDCAQVYKIGVSEDYPVAETNPFQKPLPGLQFEHAQSPYVLRMRLMWREMPEVILDHFPAEPGPPTAIKAFMERIEEVYVNDAYHSLSIEGYRVSEDLIRRITGKDWSPETIVAEHETKNALAARLVLAGPPQGEGDHREDLRWYQPGRGFT